MSGRRGKSRSDARSAEVPIGIVNVYGQYVAEILNCENRLRQVTGKSDFPKPVRTAKKLAGAARSAEGSSSEGSAAHGIVAGSGGDV